ncbi:hypothetical protein MMC26_000063 [Xylographa opegraphella]|nr:hypothetical protein [Xylographa opegraphella]
MTQSDTAAGSTAGKDSMSAVKSAVSGVHGMGETIRGTIKGAVDTAFNDQAGQAKNRSIAAKGVAEMQDGEPKGHGDGAHAGAVGSMSSVPSVDEGPASSTTAGGHRTL